MSSVQRKSYFLWGDDRFHGGYQPQQGSETFLLSCSQSSWRTVVLVNQ